MKCSLWHQAGDPLCPPIFGVGNVSCPGSPHGVTARSQEGDQIPASIAPLVCGFWVLSLPKAQDTVMLSDVI